MYLSIEQWNTGYIQLLRDCRGHSTHKGNQDGSNGSTGSVLMLCALDADAMCAARILTYCLRGDGIPYQLRPCVSAVELERILSVSMSKASSQQNPQEIDSHDGDNVRAILLLNLGGMKNLTRVVNQYAESVASKRIYVLDAHRPVHLANIHAGKEVVVFVEDLVESEIPSDGDWLSGEEDDEEEEDGSSVEGSVSDKNSEAESNIDSEAEPEDLDKGETEFDTNEMEDTEVDKSYIAGDDLNSDADPRDQEKLDEDQTDGDDLNSDADDSDQEKLDEDQTDGDDLKSVADDSDQESAAPQKKKLRRGEPETRENLSESKEDDHLSETREETQEAEKIPLLSFDEQVRQRKAQIAIYYNAGTSFGVPSAWVAYTLCQRYLRFGNVGHLLWLACVGVTDAFLHGRIDTLGYAELAEDLMRHVHRLYPNDLVDRALRRGAVYAVQEDLTQEFDHDDPNALGDAHRTTVAVSEAGKILCQKDFKFMLLRHWTLYDSMRYSNYVATKLQVYTSEGRQRLKELLARMGFPLEECKQSYAFMRPIMKGRLQQKLHDYAQVCNFSPYPWLCLIQCSHFSFYD